MPVSGRERDSRAQKRIGGRITAMHRLSKKVVETVFTRTLVLGLSLALFLPLNALAQIEWVEFSTYYPGNRFSPIKSGPSDPAFVAIRSMIEWTKVWNGLHPILLRPLPAPSGQEAIDH